MLPNYECAVRPCPSPAEAPSLAVKVSLENIACVCTLSHVQFFATPWTIAFQAPLSVAFSRHEYGSGLPFPSPGDLPNPGIEPASSALAGRFLAPVLRGKP